MEKKEIVKSLLEPYEEASNKIANDLYAKMDGFEERMLNNLKK